MKSIGRNGLLLMLLSLALTWVSCSEDTLDMENPDVDLFVKQLKDGTLAVSEDTGTVLIIFSFSSCFLFSRWQASAR